MSEVFNFLALLLGGGLGTYLFNIYWHREILDLELDLVTEFHPDCDSHDHLVNIHLSVSNNGSRPIRIKKIYSQSITRSRPNLKIKVLDPSSELDGQVLESKGSSFHEQLLDNFPERPIMPTDSAWEFSWSIEYSGCKNRPRSIDCEIETARKLWRKVKLTDGCNHEDENLIHRKIKPREWLNKDNY